jgi:D-glycero-D-manno-heptose 1,7-bisphosphate phosphatase
MRAAFLDRDGVINRNAPIGDYIRSVREFELLPGVANAIRVLNQMQFRVIVVTNQRGVARGLMTASDVEEIHESLRAQVNQSGAHIDAIYYCPHEEDTCDCRKPATGMFLQALKDFPDIELTDSVVIGDSPSDMDAAKALGCDSFFIAETAEASRCATEHGIKAAGSLLEAVERHIGATG